MEGCLYGRVGEEGGVYGVGKVCVVCEVCVCVRGEWSVWCGSYRCRCMFGGVWVRGMELV